jgi:hypothetical protein
MKLVKAYFVDIPLCMFKYKYGINIDDALDLCHERGKVLAPIILRRAIVSTGVSNFTFTQESQELNELYLVFISDMVIKNDTVASFKEEIVEVS